MAKPDVSKLTSIDLEPLAREYRTQKIIFETARDVYDLMKTVLVGEPRVAHRPTGEAGRAFCLIRPAPHHTSTVLPRRYCAGVLIITLNMTKVVQHVLGRRASREHGEA